MPNQTLTATCKKQNSKEGTSDCFHGSYPWFTKNI